MLKKQMTAYIEEISKGAAIEMYKEEKEYAETHQLFGSNPNIVEKDANFRFAGAYIERSNKESEELIAEEGITFLIKPVSYLKEHMDEFVYIESEWFNLIGVDSVSLEVDDVFGTYDAMLSLKMQKKYGPAIKKFIHEEVNQEKEKVALMFESQDGAFSLNFAIDALPGFEEEMSIGEAFILLYRFLFKLAAAMEQE